MVVAGACVAIIELWGGCGVAMTIWLIVDHFVYNFELEIRAWKIYLNQCWLIIRHKPQWHSTEG